MKTKQGEKEKLRRHILEKAAAYFKENGRSGSATDAIMESAGLTKGALYSHFKSKDDLFTEAICYDLERLHERIEHRIAREGAGALKGMIEDHLSEKSLSDVAESCVLTSLSSDMNRCKAIYRGRFEERLQVLYEDFAKALAFHFPAATPKERLRMSHLLYSALVGSLSMARSLKDKNEALQILKEGRAFLTESFVRAST